MHGEADVWAMSEGQRRAVLAQRRRETPGWVVARTDHGSEHRARVNSENQGFTCYLPRSRSPAVIGGRLTSREALVFPGFLFVLVVQRWYSLLSTRGVRSVIMSGDDPARLRETDLQNMREAEDDDGFVVMPRRPRFRPGDAVTVGDRGGKFAGIRGIYESSTGAERCRVLLGMLGGARVTLPERDLELTPKVA